ncbi:MAG: serine/threonine-protein kinase [Vicinamibacterales bacterium]
MDVAAWATISRLLDLALELPPDHRVAWVDHLGPEHDALKPQLRAMLSRAASDDGFLDSLPALADDEPAALGERAPGDLIGPYRLVREIAAGGQGAVWLAERPDGMPARPVALKLPHGLAFRPRLAERMARERDILASLTHPHIARLYDAGLSADGAPYLALEYVEGTALDRHCEDRALDVPARVRLVIAVARAVAFAHGRLVLHRDLKPSNILVTADGDVRLLDFGIARLLDDDRPLDSTLTREGGRAMTLRYASPEQVAHAPLGVASDVYALGVVLYELLTGTMPCPPARDTVGALEDAILSADPVRPSDAAADPVRRRLLRGDLDTILLKALRKAPAERYGTAAAFADDLERFLDGRPVVARPDRASYRARKFVARHRLQVVLAATAFVAIVAGAGIAVWQARVARAERDAARLQQARAQASSNFLQSLLQQAPTDRPFTATELLDRGAAQLDRATSLDDAVLAFLKYEISTHYTRFNQVDRERQLLADAADRARRAGDADLEAAARCSLAWSESLRDLPAALASLASGREAFNRLERPSFDALSDCLRAESRVLELQGRAPEAIALLEARLPALPPPTADTWARTEFLRSLLADLYRRVDRFQDALRLSEEGLAEIRQRGEAGTLNEFGAINNVAGNLSRLGEVRAAHARYEELLAWLDRDVFPVAPIAVQANVGFSALRLGRAEEALRLAEAERSADVRAGNPAAAAIADLLAARALLPLGRAAESTRRVEAAEAFWSTNPRGFARLLLEARMHRAELRAAGGDRIGASAESAEILTSLGYPSETRAPGLDRVLRLAARLAIDAGNPAPAVGFATDALAIATTIARDPASSADVGEAALLRAQAQAALGEQTRADADAQFAAQALEASLGSDHASTAAARTLLSRAPATPPAR